MEDVQEQQPQQQQQQQGVLRPSYPPVVKWVQDQGPADGDGGQSFGQDSGYTSYQSTTPNNTFNLSSRHGISSVTLATIDEANEIDCSMNDSYGGCGPSAVNLTPKTAASMVALSNIHLTTPKSTGKRTCRPITFDCDGSAGGTSTNTSTSFLAPSTPERLPGGGAGGLSRSISFELPETPLRTGNRSASQPSSQLTPHKAKGAGSLKRKHSTFREKLYSDGDVPAVDENRPRDLNDSFDADCRRLEDISPILNVKRRKQQEDRGIEDLMRSSTPKTASSQPTFLQLDDAQENRPTVKRTFRKFQSFSPSKMQSNVRTLRPLVRQHALRTVERTPEKRNEHRVLAEIHPQPPAATETIAAIPLNLATLLDAPILGDPSRQLEQTVTTVPAFDDFSLTPSKANLIDPELLADTSFPTEDASVQARHVANFSYAPTLNSILEESPVKGPFVAGKLPLPKTPPPSVTKSGRKVKRLGTNGSSAYSSATSSPARSVRSLAGSCTRHTARASVSPKAHRFYGGQNQSYKASKPYSYCGTEHMNILHHLSKHNPDALETLLEYLDATDLVQVVRVSRGWKEIIRNHRKSWKRLQCHLKQLEQHKENGGIPKGVSFTSSLLGSESVAPTELLMNGTLHGDLNGRAVAVEEAAAVPVIPPDASVPKRQPFKVCNSLDSSHASVGNASFAHGGSFVNVSGPDLGRRRSSVATSTSVVQTTPVSPSMRKFVTNQKIASHLKQSEQLRPCPRCEQPSRIIRASKATASKSRSSARYSAVGARLEKSYTLPDPDTITLTNATSTSGYRNNGLSSSNNTHSSTDAVAVHRNNNDYPEQSPDRVRKNLFNSSSTTTTTALGNEQRMKLRSAATAHKSLDCSPSVGEDVLGVRDAKCDYAICSGPFCGFRFCIKCLCEYHPNTVCADLAANSPTKEEDRGRPNMACSRQSRRSLQRLCRKQ